MFESDFFQCVLESCGLSRNVVQCLSTGCVAGRGAAYFGDSGSSAISNCHIKSNVVNGVGGGGGLSAEGEVLLNVVASLVWNNSAQEGCKHHFFPSLFLKKGGGALLFGDAVVTAYNTHFVENTASFVAGAISASGPITVNLTKCLLLNNVGLRISNIMAFDNDRKSHFFLRNNIIRAGKGIVSLILGNIDLFEGNVINCTIQGGTP